MAEIRLKSHEFQSVYSESFKNEIFFGSPIRQHCLQFVHYLSASHLSKSVKKLMLSRAVVEQLREAHASCFSSLQSSNIMTLYVTIVSQRRARKRSAAGSDDGDGAGVFAEEAMNAH